MSSRAPAAMPTATAATRERDEAGSGDAGERNVEAGVAAERIEGPVRGDHRPVHVEVVAAGPPQPAHPPRVLDDDVAGREDGEPHLRPVRPHAGDAVGPDPAGVLDARRERPPAGDPVAVAGRLDGAAGVDDPGDDRVGVGEQHRRSSPAGGAPGRTTRWTRSWSSSPPSRRRGRGSPWPGLPARGRRPRRRGWVAAGAGSSRRPPARGAGRAAGGGRPRRRRRARRPSVRGRRWRRARRPGWPPGRARSWISA